MSPDEFRKNGHAVIEWVANYLERVGDYPVLPTVQPGDISAMIPDVAPETSEPFAQFEHAGIAVGDDLGGRDARVEFFLDQLFRERFVAMRKGVDKRIFVGHACSFIVVSSRAYSTHRCFSP